MSASRPKLAKPKPKPRPFTVEKPDQELLARSTTSSIAAGGPSKVRRPATNGTAKKKESSRAGSKATGTGSKGIGGSSGPRAVDKGKGKAGEFKLQCVQRRENRD